MNIFYLLNKEIKYIIYHYRYFYLFYLFYLILICLFIFNFDPNSKLILNISVININFILTTVLSSSYFFILYKKNGILELYLLSHIQFQFFIFLKSILYWFFIMIPLCLFISISLLFFNINNHDFYILLFSYIVFTLIIVFTNVLLSIITINIQYENIFIFIFNIIINIPMILYLNSLINNNIFDMINIVSLFIYLLFIIYTYPFICLIFYLFIH